MIRELPVSKMCKVRITWYLGWSAGEHELTATIINESIGAPSEPKTVRFTAFSVVLEVLSIENTNNTSSKLRNKNFTINHEQSKSDHEFKVFFKGIKTGLVRPMIKDLNQNSYPVELNDFQKIELNRQSFDESSHITIK